ncbi:MAG: hypothetical protein ACI3VE_05720, partial [Oscillospiraceae bacterium]
NCSPAAAGGRPMAAPTGAITKPFCHSENDKISKTSAENNRAVAIEKRTILMRIGGLPRPSIARPLRTDTRPVTIELIIYYHMSYKECSNDTPQDDIFLYTILIIYLLKNGYNFAII